MDWQLAQLNIARMRAPLEDVKMRGFADGLEAMNQLAEGSDGFIWRLKDEGGDATQLSPFDDPTILVNMSLWRDIVSLQDYAYKSEHRHFIKSRRDWFEDLGDSHQVLWWVPAGVLPTTTEAKARLMLLRNRGLGPWAFVFKTRFEAPKIIKTSAKSIAQHVDLLERSGLNAEDFAQLSPSDFIHVEQGDYLAAGIAVQVFSESALLRSLVTADEVRGAGLARDLVRLAVDRARQQGLKSLFLLTQTASRYFERMGFEYVDRQSVPRGVAGSSQFSELCPADSDCLVFNL